MDITSVRTSGLGDTSYVFAFDGVAVIVDPQRDIDRFVESAAGLDVRFVLETHLHNDYVSGAIHLAENAGAELVMPAASGAAYQHVPAFHHEDLDAGAFRVRPIHTPGHTPEHTSYLMLIDDEPVAVFTGGSLLVGSAGRPDLLGRDRAEQLARLQYISVNRLGALPDAVELLPTHGQGSFCTVSLTTAGASTIGAEKRSNPMLQYDNPDSFAKAQLESLQPFPDYYAHMGPINLMGPAPLPPVVAPEIAVAGIPSDAAVIDVRPKSALAEGHLPGALRIPYTDNVAVWAGWLVPFDQPVVIVADRDQPVADVIVQFYRIGFDDIAGVVHDLSDAELVTFAQATASDIVRALDAGEPSQIIDVRAPHEYESERIPGSIHAYVPDLRSGVPAEIDSDADVMVVCGTGQRATVAASLLERAGVTPVVVAHGGVPDVLRQLEVGPAE